MQSKENKGLEIFNLMEEDEGSLLEAGDVYVYCIDDEKTFICKDFEDFENYLMHDDVDEEYIPLGEQLLNEVSKFWNLDKFHIKVVQDLDYLSKLTGEDVKYTFIFFKNDADTLVYGEQE